MNDDASEVRRLLSPLRDRPVSVDPERLAARRSRVVTSLKREVHALATQRAERPRRRAGFAALALAAAACLLAGARVITQYHAAQSTATLTFVGSVGDTVTLGGPSPRNLQSGESLTRDPGEIDTAEQGSAELVGSAGLGLRLGSATRVALGGLLGSAPKNQAELRQGLLTCTVPHLSEGQRFSVSTPDARVVVHGTVFSVRVDSKQASGSQTCVSVTDGVVIVQHAGTETALNAGDSWGCSQDADGDAKPSDTAQQDVTQDGEGSATNRGTSHGVLHAPDHGTLSDENRLFQAALAAERLGQQDKAELDLNRLLSKYPSSPLGPEARRALSRIAGNSAGK
ncbi:MAG TPA: FecR domain-containing protein [Polyangiaceae bacterium]|jgi:ferric-dicitrate binding protein FerR (iron transport regulator)|nr:FecR domain-containing protein [Polyangiaceae bacterium]